LVVGVFGVPLNAATLCARMIRLLLARTYGACEVIAAANLENVKEHWPKQPTSVLCYNELPQAPLLWLLLEQKVPIIVFVSSFEETVRGLVAERNLSLLEAVRRASLCFSCLREAILARNVMVVPAGAGLRNIPSLLGQAASYLGIPARPDITDSIIDELHRKGDIEGRPRWLPPREKGKHKGAKHVELGRSQNPKDVVMPNILNCYDKLLYPQQTGTISWPIDVFNFIDKKPETAAGTVELLGPARYLFAGPYMGLPRGRWTASVTFSVDENLSGNKLVVDAATNRGQNVLVSGEFVLPVDGSYVCEVDFEISQPHMAIEVRAFLKQGAIEGKFWLGEVGLTPHPN
jgi:hypothetical protein